MLNKYHFTLKLNHRILRLLTLLILLNSLTKKIFLRNELHKKYFQSHFQILFPKFYQPIIKEFKLCLLETKAQMCLRYTLKLGKWCVTNVYKTMHILYTKIIHYFSSMLYKKL